MADPDRKPHAVLIPMPFQGHIFPAVQLAIKLAAKGFTITFVNTEAVHDQISQTHHSPVNHDIFSDARASTGLDIRYELIGDGLPISFERSPNENQLWYAILYLFPTHVEDLVRKLLLMNPPVTCLIADGCFGWPSTMAKKLGLTYVSFWTEPATVFTLYCHVDLLVTNGHYACQENRKDTITYIPGVPAIEPNDLMSYLQTNDIPPIIRQIILKSMEENKGADFVLCNTVEELELEAISALQREKLFYAVGPIFPEDFTRSMVAASLRTESDCSQWLDSKPAGSVLYVSFGSFANVSKRDLEEIAYGILECKANFVWAIRPDIVGSDEPEPLPKEFLEECHEKGIVVPWCCQREVLSHPSIGGFLTHCGWNSVLESIWCAVPLLCFPLVADQFTNRKLVVQDWKIGIEIGGLNNTVSRNEVSKKIDSLMGGQIGELAREKIKELKKALESALALTGSSQKNFDRFIVDVMKHIQKKRLM